MKRLILVIVLIASFVLPGSIALASDISGAFYRMGIIISNNGGLSDSVATVANISTLSLIGGDFMNTSGNNVVMRDSLDNDVAFMPGYDTNDWGLWLSSIGADTYLGDYLYTADSSGGKIRYFPGAGGMTVSDVAGLELGNNFKLNTSSYVLDDGYIVEKPYAFNIERDGTDVNSSILYQGAFPVIAAVNTNITNPAAQNHTVFLPAGIAAGHLLLCQFGVTGNPVVTFPAGWVNLYYTFDTAGASLGTWYKIADGTEGASINVTTDVNQQSAHFVYRITGYSGVPVAGTTAVGNSANPDPPNLTPGWNGNSLWIAVEENWPGAAWVASPGGFALDGNNGVGLTMSTSSRSFLVPSLNPGSYTIAAPENWTANTICVGSTHLTTSATVTEGEHDLQAWADGTCFELDRDNTTIVMNGSFELGNPPTSWTANGGGGGSIAQTAAEFVVDTHGLAVTCGAGSWETANYIADAAIGNDITIGCWVKTNIAGATTSIIINDGGVFTKTYAIQDGAWHWLEANKTIVNLPLTISAGVETPGAGGTAYFDGFVGIRSTSVSAPSDGDINCIALAGASVWDNAEDYTFFTNDATPYAESASIDVAGSPVSAWEWEYGTTFQDSIGANDATPTFISSSSDPSVIAYPATFQPLEEAKAPAFTLDSGYTDWFSAPNITGNFTTTPSSTFPGASVIVAIANASSTPSQLPLTIILGFVILAASLSTSYSLRSQGSGSLLVKAIVIGGIMGIGIATSSIDLWMLIFFAFIAFALGMASKQGSNI